MRFVIVNVFTALPHAGNQLAVVFPTEQLSDERMQKICWDFNYSETVFVYGKSLRIFSPSGELPFAGHPTIGTAWVLGQELKSASFTLETKRGPLPVKVQGSRVDLVFPGSPTVTDYHGDLSELARAYGVPLDQIDPLHVREVNAGPQFVLVPIKSEVALENAHRSQVAGEKRRAYFVHRSSATTASVRLFSPALSKGEDAATGSAACALAGWLQQIAKEPRGELTISQGKQIARPSQLFLRWGDEIELGGEVRLWAEGTLT